jgi:hypothetical protein
MCIIPNRSRVSSEDLSALTQWHWIATFVCYDPCPYVTVRSSNMQIWPSFNPQRPFAAAPSEQTTAMDVFSIVAWVNGYSYALQTWMMSMSRRRANRSTQNVLPAEDPDLEIMLARKRQTRTERSRGSSVLCINYPWRLLVITTPTWQPTTAAPLILPLYSPIFVRQHSLISSWLIIRAVPIWHLTLWWHDCSFVTDVKLFLRLCISLVRIDDTGRMLS